jgi:hypothetical protein
MKYYELIPDIFAEYVPDLSSELPYGLSLILQRYNKASLFFNKKVF